MTTQEIILSILLEDDNYTSVQSIQRETRRKAREAAKFHKHMYVYHRALVYKYPTMGD